MSGHTPMKTFSCAVLIDASKSEDIEAETPHDAADKAMEKLGWVTLCHQCSNKVETGDALGVVVCDKDGTELLDTTFNGECIAALEKQRDKLLTAIGECRDAMPSTSVRVNDAIADPLAVPDYVRACVAVHTELLNECKATLKEQGHLADGEQCTLIRLKLAVEKATGEKL